MNPHDEAPEEVPGQPHRTLDAGERARRALGPAVFALSVVLAVLLWTRGPERGGSGWNGEQSTPALPDSAGVEGWAGSFEVAGGTLHARLSPLHADPARQRFDAQALRRRLDLGEGEPWSLVLRFVSASSTARLPLADARILALAPAASPSEGEGTPAEAAASLRPILSPGAASDDPTAPTDPLRCLLEPPAALAPGEETTLVLWGPRPTAGPAVAGTRGPLALWLPVDPPASSGSNTFPLEARSFEDLALQPTLARLDRRTSHRAPGSTEESR